MAGGFGKNSRGGKRGSSASSYASTTAVILLVGFCLYGVYMLSSSFSSSSSSTRQSNNIKPHKRPDIPSSSSSYLPQTVLRYPPPIAAASDGGSDNIIKNNNNDEDEQQNEEDQEEEKTSAISANSSGTEEDSLQPEQQTHQQHREEEAEERRQQDEEVETRRSDEEFQQRDADQQQQQQNEDSANQSEDQQQNDSIGSGRSNGEEPDQSSNEQQQQQPPQQDEAAEEKNDDQQQQQQKEETTEEKNGDQQQEKAAEQNNDEQRQGTTEQNNDEERQQQQSETTTTEQNNDEERQQTMEQDNDEQVQSETLREEGNQDESNNESQQQSQTDIEDIQQDQNQQQHIQQVTEGTRSQSKEEGGGITSQSQIEHDTDRTTGIHEQEQQQRRQQQQQQQKQQQMEQENAAIGGSNEDNLNASFPDRTEPAVPNTDQKTWATQADQSSNEKERRKGDESSQSDGGEGEGNSSGGDGSGKSSRHEWELCNVTAGPDYIPCLDNEKAIKQLHSFRHFEHRERHCPEESPTCLVPLPKGYKRSIEWPQSRDRIWYNNVPRTKLAEVKGHQNWVKVTGEYLTFPGGGTQFIHGALHYIDFIQKSLPEIAWGKHTRVILDVGCGVASFGGYLFERDVLAMSFAPKDEHEAQVQFALERGIPAISAVMGSQRLPFPSRVFDIVHCARCRVPWHANDGALLLELNRVLRPGGFFVWSATPVYQKLKEDVDIWKAMTALTKSMCWELHAVKRDKLNSVGAAMYRKPVSNECYDKRKVHKPPMCKEDDDPNAAWYVPLQSCMHRVPVDPSVRGSQWPQKWPRRLQVPPYWLNSSQTGVYGRPAPGDFTRDNEHWKRVVNKSYLTGFGIDWSRVRNVMDMRAVYGGFAAALKDMKVWVMNLVNIDSPDTLPIIYERGLFGMYHDWCESFSTYPRTYDLLHADHLFSQVKKRCEVLPVIAEVDRIVRPGGKLIVRDESEVVSEVEDLLRSLHWEIRLTYSKNQEGILCAEKSVWRPEKFSASA